MNSKTGKEKAITKSPSRLFILVVLLIAFLTLANMTIAFAQPKDKVNGELWVINRVVSGQTVEASVVSNPNMTVQRVRLLGISAPLKEQSPWGDRARQSLSDLIKEQKVILEFDVKQKDNSDRLLAYSYSPNVKYDARISRAQSKARLQELGIWDTQNPLRLSPRDFRRQLSN